MKLFLDDCRNPPDMPRWYLTAEERAAEPPSEFTLARSAKVALALIAEMPRMAAWSVDHDLGYGMTGWGFLVAAAEQFPDKWPRGNVTVHSTSRDAYRLRNFIRQHEDGDAAVLEPDPYAAPPTVQNALDFTGGMYAGFVHAPVAATVRHPQQQKPKNSGVFVKLVRKGKRK